MPRLHRILLGLLIAGLIAPATSAAQPANDHRSSPADRRLNTQFVNETNVGAGYGEAGYEEFTPAGDLWCNDTAQTDMGSTVWFRIPGTGGPIRVTVGGNFDRLVAAYDAANNPTGCVDDFFTSPESILFQSTAGATHLIQVGGLFNYTTRTAAQGTFDFTALSNDYRSHPETVQPDPVSNTVQVTRTNIGATEEDEPRSCNGRSYHSTVWFRYVAPELGTVTFSASRLSLAIAAYRGGQQVSCGTSGPGSELAASTSVNVAAGQEILVQVGGLLNPGEDNINYSVTFNRNCDADGDTVFDAHRATCGGRDCDDSTGAIRPGNPELVNNAVDENCDNVREFDRDGDGYRVSQPEPNPRPSNYDCNDTPGIGARINPGRRDVRGNRLNEDCKGGPAKALALPSSIRDFWTTARGGAAVRSMKVTSVKRRSRIKVTCRGSGCAFKRRTIKVTRRAKAVKLTGLFRGTVLRPGGRVEVKVLPPSIEWIGPTESYRLRRGVVTPRKGCVSFRGRRVKCP